MSAGTGFTPPADDPCYDPRMTRAQALALRAGGLLRENCVVVITDGPVIGTAGNTSPTEIELNPTSPTNLGLTARVNPLAFDVDTAWSGTFDIDLGTAGSITQLTDDWGNTGKDVDADSPTVHTQWPWHKRSTTWRDNYVEDAVLPGIGATVTFRDNNVRNSTLDMTATTGGSVIGSEFNSANITAGPTLTATRAFVHAGVWTLGDTGTTTLTDARIFGSTLTRGAGATGGLTVTRSTVDASTLAQGAGSTGTIGITDSQVSGSTGLNVDAGSVKSISVLASELLGYSIRTQDAVAGAATLSRCNAYGKPTNGDSFLVRGAGAGGSVLNSTVDGNSVAPAGQGSIHSDGPASSFLISNAVIQDSRITIGAGAGAFQSTGARFDVANINALGPGRLTINYTQVAGGGTITHALAATDSLQTLAGRVEGGGLIELTSGARGLIVSGTDVLNGRITQTSVNASSLTNTNQVTDCRVIDQGRIVFSDTAAAGQTGCSVSKSTVKGSALGAGVDGVLTITGTSAAVVVDSVDCRGVMTLTNVPAGALSAGTSFHDLRVGPVSSLTYTGGDGVAKQIRNITVEDLSTLTLTGLTGSAGVSLADVFAGQVRGQSAMAVTGARVAGQPVRNFTVADGSTLNVAASGTVLQCQVRAGATLNTGAFRHSESVIEGSITKTATAPNVFRLASKAFDDWI